MGARAFGLSASVRFTRRLFLFLAVLAAPAAAPSAGAAGEEIYEAFRPGSVLLRVADLERCRVAVLEGSSQLEALKARVRHFEPVPCMDTAGQTAAILEGRAEAAVMPLQAAETLANADSRLRVMPERLGDAEYALAFRYYSADLQTIADSVILAMREDGSLAEMTGRWLARPAGGGDAPAMPDIPARPDALPLRVGVTPTLEPFCYPDGEGRPIGLDVELARRVAHAAKMNMTITTMEYGHLFPTLKNGNIDMIAACVDVTPARKEEMRLSEPYFHGAAAILIRTPGAASVHPEG